MAFSTGNDSGGPMSEINVTPLVDVMLVLLIIFMITAPLMSHKTKVELPKADYNSRTPDKAAAIITVAVTADGKTYLNDVPVNREQLEQTFSVEAQKEPQPQVNIRGDATTPYRHVRDVVNLAQLQGFQKVGFVATKER
jgi:biopolymer transport protein ExbD